jgi:hypothetical protein
MRITREFGRGLSVALLLSQLPFSAVALLRFAFGREAIRPRTTQRPARGEPDRQRGDGRARSGRCSYALSVSIGRLASRAHSPIEPS